MLCTGVTRSATEQIGGQLTPRQLGQLLARHRCFLFCWSTERITAPWASLKQGPDNFFIERLVQNSNTIFQWFQVTYLPLKVWKPLLYLCLHGRFNEVTSLLFLFVSGRVVFQIWGATTAKWKDFSWQDVHFSRWTSTKYVHIGAVRPPFNRNVYSDLDSQNLV